MSILKQQTARGVKWVLGITIAQRALAFVTTVILARILVPSDFGLFALAFVLIDALSIFKSLGFDSALIQRKDNSNKTADTAFAIIPFLGVSLFILLYLVAPVASNWLGNIALTKVIRTLGVIFIFSCFGRVPSALLSKNLKIKERSIAEIISSTVYSAIAVILALLKFGVWSLVVAYIFKNIIQVSLVWFYAKWRPTFQFDKRIAWEMFHFGKYISGGSFLGFLKNNLDKLFVGKLLGVGSLGFYAIAFNISSMPTKYLIGRLWNVFFPAYSKIKDDLYDLKRAFLKILKYTALLTIPFSVTIYILAPDFLSVVFGEKWLPAAGVLKILAIAGGLNILAASVSPVLVAKGKSKADFFINFIRVTLFLALITPAVRYFKLIGAGYVVLLVNIVTTTISLVWMRRLLHIKFKELLSVLKPSFLGSLSMTAIILLVKYIQTVNCIAVSSQIIDFLTLITVGGAIYCIMVLKSERTIFKEIKELLA